MTDLDRRYVYPKFTPRQAEALLGLLGTTLEDDDGPNDGTHANVLARAHDAIVDALATWRHYGSRGG